MLHVAFVYHAYVSGLTAEQLLEQLFSIPDWAGAVRKAGAKVTVIIRFDKDEEITLNGVDYIFVKDSLRPDLRSFQFAWSFHKKAANTVRKIGADAVHLHNPLAFGALFAMCRLVKDVPVVIQDHVGMPQLKRPWLLRQGVRLADKVIFAAPGQEKCWLEEGVLEQEQVGFVMENSSSFTMSSRIENREKTGLKGTPVFLWVGNLNDNKDPFTMLKAFRQIKAENPQAQLYMIYREDFLKVAIEDYLEQHKPLKKAVSLLGPKDHEALEQHYNSADYFLLASHKEGSGYSAIEAISCGVVPILSDIPSFRQITNHEEIGCLFESGNADEMAEKALALLKRPLVDERERTAAYFQRALSFEKIGRDMMNIYQTLVDKKRG